MTHKQHKEINKCLLCDGVSPNNYGECICSYEEAMFTNNYKKIAEILSKICKKQMKFIIKSN